MENAQRMSLCPGLLGKELFPASFESHNVVFSHSWCLSYSSSLDLLYPSSTLEVWWWRRLSRVPWAARRSKESILKEINSEYSLEGLLLKLKFQYFGHLMQRAGWLEKTLMLRKIEGKMRRGQQRMRWLDSIIDSMAWIWANSGR